MLINKRLYALVGVFLLAVFQISNGFNMGSRGLTDGDMAKRAVGEKDAGNDEQIKEPESNPKTHSPKLLKVLSNKEYLFGEDDDSSGEVKDTSVEQKTLLAEPVELEDEGEEESEFHLKREQRTHPSPSMKDDDLESLINELYRLKEMKELMENRKEFTSEENDPYIDYDLLLENKLNSENEMSAKEVKGPAEESEQSDQEEFGHFLEYLDENGLGNKLEEFLEAQEEPEAEMASSDDENDDHGRENEVKFQKPIVHFKETFISGDTYNKKLLDQDEVQNANFKYVSESLQPTKHPDSVQHAKLQHEDNTLQRSSLRNKSDFLFLSVIAGCAMAGLLAVLAGGVCYYKMNKTKSSGFEGSGVSKSGSLKSNSSSSSGDRRLAQSAQMFHYQHQKQQMIAMEKANTDTKQDQSDNSEGEAEEGDYTVYECPGLAPTGEMEVKNPLFKEDYSSSHNILASSTSITSMPPPYSAVSAVPEGTKDQTKLIEINETNAVAAAITDATVPARQ